MEEAGAVVAGPLAWRAVRVEVGEPVMGMDVDERTIPQEAGLVEKRRLPHQGLLPGPGAGSPDRLAGTTACFGGLVVEVNLLPPEGAGWVETPGGCDHLGGRVAHRSSPCRSRFAAARVAPGDRVEVRWDGGSAPARVSELPLVGGGY